ncbi:hypothetical protein [Subtercola sp. RTI3]|uniref:hypothetical protein n=1 Tax=Subtercola sp. RTI3 TaxID=3048639 RepID=UPI002B22E6D4|nr:hypothetical protein [Subtercola sp. RTI3]MEA9984611.1 hypothetical protein [Subtercola sp. RTI3]
MSSILVDTRTIVEGRLQRRLMAASLGRRFDRDDVRFTGRHWWGAIADDGIPDPLIDEEAQVLGSLLGLAGFSGDDTGTDVYILDADFGVALDDSDDDPVEPTPEEAAKFIASAISWNLWPKMIGNPAGMSFHVDLDGTAIPIPDPTTDAQLRPFTKALEMVRSGGGHQYRRAAYGEIGRLAVETELIIPGVLGSTDSKARAFEGPSHHVARMRDAELIVDYIEGPAPVDVAIKYGGVFRASQQADDEFAAAEPPTHDNWVEQGLSPSALSIVRGARQWIRGRLRTMYEQTAPSGTAIGGLGALSSRLAILAPALTAGGAGPETERGPREGGGGRGSSGRTPTIRIGPPHLEDRGGTRVIVTEVSLAGVDRQRRLTCSPAVVVDGGRESNLPVGLSMPRVLSWETGDGQVLVLGETFDVVSGTPDNVVVVVELLPDVVTRIDVKESGLHA